MPYNFNTTFVLPLVADMDQGKLASSQNLANAITDYYINTIKAGLPQNVPPTLPAPAQLGVPYPIGAIGYITADSGRQKFYNVIYKYLTAKDKITKKRKLSSILTDIAATKRLINQKEAQIQSLIDQSKSIIKEIESLPTLVKDLGKGLKQVSFPQVQVVTELESLINRTLSQNAGEIAAGFFARELGLINQIKSFNIENIQAALELATFLQRGLQQAETAITRNGTLAATVRNYVVNKLKTVISFFIGLIDIITDPKRALSYARRFLNQVPGAAPILKILNKIRVIELFLKPKLLKFERQIENIRRELQTNLQERLRRLGRAKSNVQDLPTSKRKDKFLKAAEIKKRQAEKAQKRIKRIKTKIQLTADLVRSVAVIAQQVQLLKTELPKEFEILAKTLPKISTSRQGTAAQSVVGSTISNATPSTVLNLSTGTALLAGAGVGTAQLYTQLNLDKTQRETLRDYMSEIELPEFLDTASKTINTAATDFFAFKTFFERTDARYRRYTNSIVLLETSILKAYATLSELVSGVKVDYVPRATTPIKDKSLRDVLIYLKKQIEPSIKRLQERVAARLEEEERKRTEETSKAAAQKTATASQLAPTSTKVESGKRKQKELSAKDREARQIKNKIKRYVSYTGALGRAASAATALGSNLANADYLDSANVNYINTIVDSLYTVKLGEATDETRANVLEQRDKVKKQLKKIQQIATLAAISLEVYKSFANKDFVEEWNAVVEDLQKTDPSAIASIPAITTLLTNPPKTLKDYLLFVKNLSNSITLSVIQVSSLGPKLAQLERKYIKRIQIIVNEIRNIAEIDPNEDRKISKILTSNKSLVIYILSRIDREIKVLTKTVNDEVQSAIFGEQSVIQKKIYSLKNELSERIRNLETRLVSGIETRIFSRILGAAARAFWTNATWIGPSGSQHKVISIGSFKRIKARPVDGTSAFVENMGKSFARQLANAKGIITPPPVTGITPITFTGYK